MNCFEWQTRSSDYLDGTLTASQKKLADQHLNVCAECNERHQRYQQIINTLRNQPRIPLPVSIRKSPFSFHLSRSYLQSHRSRWEQAPWFVRSSIEGIGIAVAILFVVTMVPKVRLMYERSMERKLDVFTAEEALTSESQPLTSAPLARGKSVTTDEKKDAEEFPGEFAGENDDDDVQSQETETTGTPVRVGNSQIWRFIVRTDSPHEIRPKIVEILESLGVQKETPGIGGIEAPGGIQFDLLVPQNAIAGLKPQLQKLANPALPVSHQSRDGVPINETFTWYKNKSKRPIPSGKTRVVIWLSQT